MKILLISDIHGIKDNLSYIDSYIENNNITNLIILGDIFGYYNNHYIEEFLIKHKSILSVARGNCDVHHTFKGIEFEELIQIKDSDIDIYCTHGHVYNNNDHSFMNENDVLIYGHYHYPYIKTKDNKTFICTGSISEPRNNSKPSFTVYEDRTFTIYDTLNNLINSIKI